MKMALPLHYLGSHKITSPTETPQAKAIACVTLACAFYPQNIEGWSFWSLWFLSITTLGLFKMCPIFHSPFILPDPWLLFVLIIVIINVLEICGQWNLKFLQVRKKRATASKSFLTNVSNKRVPMAGKVLITEVTSPWSSEGKTALRSHLGYLEEEGCPLPESLSAQPSPQRKGSCSLLLLRIRPLGTSSP